MARGYGVTLPSDPARIVAMWRRANVWAPQFWRQLSSAARANGPAGRIMFGTAFKDAMPARLATLPSGRSIHYPFPEFDDEGELVYLKAAWKPKKDAKSWPRARAWGGLLAENVTQAASADLLREALVRAVRVGLPVIGHVHDELVLEESESKAALTAKTLKRTMLTAPEWARGLPLAVETDVSRRYRK
jgi:DNA polymerase